MSWVSVLESAFYETDILMQTLRRSFPIVWSKQEKELP